MSTMGRVVPVLLLPLVLLGPARAADEEPAQKEESGEASRSLRHAGKELVEGMKQAGRDIRDSKAGRSVAEGAKEIGRGTAEAGRKGWQKTKEISASAAESVRRATREFWQGVIRAREEALAKLREENRELKTRKEKGGATRAPTGKDR